MKHFLVFFTAALVFTLAGCQNQETTPVSPGDFAALSKVPVPIKIVVDGTSIVDPYNNWLVEFDATIVGSHIGKSIAVGTANLVFTSPTGGDLINGAFTITAANGDELNMVGDGTFLINGLITEYNLDFTFDGGTGRFAEATGICIGGGIGEQIDPNNPLVKSVHLEGAGNILY